MRSPTPIVASLQSARACPRPPCTASPPSTTTCSRRAVVAMSGSAPAPPCYAATGDAHVDEIRDGLGPRCSGSARRTARSPSPRRSAWASATLSPAVRDGDVIDAGPGVVERVLAGTTRRRGGAGTGERRSTSPCSPCPATTPACARRLATQSPEELLEEVVEGQRARPRWRRLPGRGRSGSFTRGAEGETKFIVASGDEGDPGSYIDKVLMEGNPELLIEGLALAGLRGRRRARLRPRALRVPALQARARRQRSPARTSRACSATTSSAAGSPST